MSILLEREKSRSDASDRFFLLESYSTPIQPESSTTTVSSFRFKQILFLSHHLLFDTIHPHYCQERTSHTHHLALVQHAVHAKEHPQRGSKGGDQGESQLSSPLPPTFPTNTRLFVQLQNPSIFTNSVYIDGEWVSKSDDGSTFTVYNKATGAELGNLPNCGASETKRAIEAAVRAYDPYRKDSWSQITAKQRADYLSALFAELNKNAQDLAHIIVAENGKSLTEAKGEIAYSNSFVEWFAAEALRTYGHVAPAPIPGVMNVVIKQPVGVCGLITPWNFPMAMIGRKVAPALAAGCTCVIKAPAETPYSALALAKLCEKVGIPKGVVNIVTAEKGDKEAAVGKTLCESKDVRKISFTGSTGVGKLLMGQSASTLKKLSFEL